MSNPRLAAVASPLFFILSDLSRFIFLLFPAGHERSDSVRGAQSA